MATSSGPKGLRRSAHVRQAARLLLEVERTYGRHREIREKYVPEMLELANCIEAFRLADPIAIMREGEVIRIGRPVDIALNPADDCVAEFIAACRCYMC